jgi:DNA-binding MarR family transcriptional regulator
VRPPALFDQLWGVLQAVGRDVHTAAAEHGLTPMQAMLLDRLADGVASPQTELARSMNCDTSNLTGLVDALESRGLVERTTPANDRRVRAVITTESGRELRATLSRRLRERNPVLGRLSAVEQRQLSGLLERLDRP